MCNKKSRGMKKRGRRTITIIDETDPLKKERSGMRGIEWSGSGPVAKQWSVNFAVPGSVSSENLHYTNLKVMSRFYTSRLQLSYVPHPRKPVHVLMFPTPHKPARLTSSFRQITLFPANARLLEKMSLRGFTPICRHVTFYPIRRKALA